MSTSSCHKNTAYAHKLLIKQATKVILLTSVPNNSNWINMWMIS